jgi:uncharacterized protein (DUF488 family)
MLVHTIGHSRRSAAELFELLRESRIELVADVRRFPRSRTNPQFNAEALAPFLSERGINYRHLPSLGGRRSSTSGAPSSNTLWRVAAFRAYADYAEGPEFRGGFDELMRLAERRRVAIMCAEAVWWQCHRRIVADYLIAAGVEVRHILAAGKVEPATLTEGATLSGGGRLSYRNPADPARLPGL